MFKKIAMGVGGLLLLLALLGVALPSQWEIERSVVIHADPAILWAKVGSLRRWPEWTVWTTAMDPSMAYEYSGPAQGVGETSTWHGEKAGNGSMTVTAWEENRGVWYSLQFEAFTPSQGEIILEKDGANTRVRWTNRGGVGWNLMSRYFVPMIKTSISKDFDGGLANLKHYAEGGK